MARIEIDSPDDWPNNRDWPPREFFIVLENGEKYKYRGERAYRSDGTECYFYIPPRKPGKDAP